MCSSLKMLILYMNLLRISDRVGTIKIGKAVDLACYNDNPAYDIEALASVAMVVKSGEVVRI